MPTSFNRVNFLSAPTCIITQRPQILHLKTIISYMLYCAVEEEKHRTELRVSMLQLPRGQNEGP